jgi:Lysylphosphatidylglycerol synthase TM region
VLTVVAGFFVLTLVSRWHQVTAVKWSLHPGYFTAACAVLVAAYALVATLWASALARVAPVGVAAGVRIWFVANLARYVPGNVWSFVGAVELARREGAPRRATLAVMALTQVLSVGVALLVGLPVLVAERDRLGRPVAVGLAVLVVLLVAVVVLWRPLERLARRRYPDLGPVLDRVLRRGGPAEPVAGREAVSDRTAALQAPGDPAGTLGAAGDPPGTLGAAGDQTVAGDLSGPAGAGTGGGPKVALPGTRAILGLALGYAVYWVLTGLAFAALVRAMFPLPASDVPLAIAGYSASYAVGFLSLLTPGGLGVREGVLVLALAPVMPAGPALVVALVSRLWMMLFELLGAVAAYALERAVSGRLRLRAGAPAAPPARRR